MIVSLLSCNSENEFIGSAQETIPDVEVSTMDMWVKETRSVSEYLNMPVLHFKDEQVYSETLRQLKNMTENERFTYFQQLGFEGAYILWEQADRELDKIFDMESDDSHLIQEMINTYKDKYLYRSVAESNDTNIILQGKKRNALQRTFSSRRAFLLVRG